MNNRYGPLAGLVEQGQSVWYDHIHRGLLASGGLAKLIEVDGVSGVTSNPTIFQKAVASGADYDAAIESLARAGLDDDAICEALIVEDIRRAADILRPKYEHTAGRDGYVSVEVRPELAQDAQGTIEEATRLFREIGRPNVMIKIPGTGEGISAVEEVIARGVPVNVTLLFSLEAYEAAANAYLSGLERRVAAGWPIDKVSSVASFFVSRVDTLVDRLLEERERQGVEVGGLFGKAAVANARLAYARFRAIFSSDRFERLRRQGAQLQRPLWASTSTKSPSYSDVLYVEALIGPDTVNTMPPETLVAFRDHGRVAPTLDSGIVEAEAVMGAIEGVGIDLRSVTDQLLTEGVAAFTRSFEQLRTDVASKAERLGKVPKLVEKVLEDLARDEVVRRLWARDASLWAPHRAEIADRLGWLEVAGDMAGRVPELEDFRRELAGEGFSDAVLVGMGGSSLGPEVLRAVFQPDGPVEGSLRLHVLDTTIPAAIRGVTEAIDPRRTLFLVSSKSGGTIEVLSLYRHFAALAREYVGDAWSTRFAAITDPGTSLERLAREHGFRRVFLNPPEIGGRYSVLSLFGLVPAALMGLDLRELLQRAEAGMEACRAEVPARNRGAWLGAFLGALAAGGRDKATLVTSPALRSFGLWVEQLLAESTGKDGRGIVPVAGEPTVGAGLYGEDRAFVYVRLAGDANAETDALVEAVRAAGHPCTCYELWDVYDLGRAFFEWEFATAVAGRILGIHPFDQPNVQESKDRTARLLEAYARERSLPRVDPGDLDSLLTGLQPTAYIALMAYVAPDQEIEAGLDQVRSALVENHGVATLCGYGPRYLHSTGQLYKGGPDTGRFLLIQGPPGNDVGIPGEPYSFGTLAEAQATGDLLALRARSRTAVRVVLGSDAAASLAELAARIAAKEGEGRARGAGGRAGTRPQEGD